MFFKTIFKKTGLSLVVLLSLSFSNQTYSMFSGMKNYCSKLIWGTPDEIRIKECLARLTDCKNKKIEPNVKDFFDVICYKSGHNTKVYHNEGEVLEYAKNKIINKPINADNLFEIKHCSSCDGVISFSTKCFSDPDLKITPCIYCRNALFCDEVCFQQGFLEHSDDCSKRISDDKAKININNITLDYLKEYATRLKGFTEKGFESNEIVKSNLKEFFDVHSFFMENFVFCILNSEYSSCMKNIHEILFSEEDNKDSKSETKTIINFPVKCLFCNNLLKNESEAMACNLCGKGFYCNQDCLLRDWKKHKEGCLKTLLEGIEEEPKTNIENDKAKSGEKSESIKSGDGKEVEIVINENTSSDIYAGRKKALSGCVKDKGYIKNNNIEYFWLKTVDHCNKEVISPVTKEFNRKRNDFATLHMYEPKKGQPRRFLPEGTSGAQAMRNSYLINDFLESTDENDEKRKSCLGDINNVINAKNYLEDVIGVNLSTSCLGAQDIESRVCELGLGEKITVLNSVLEVGTNKKQEVVEIIEKFKAPKHQHIFIVNTADMAHLEVLETQKAACEGANHCKIDDKSFKRFKFLQERANNWFVIAIEKSENGFTCLIVDTEPLKEEIQNSIKYKISKCLCEYILINNNLIDTKGPYCEFMECILKIGADVFTNAIKNGIFKNDKSYDDRLLTHQEEKILSRLLVESIYNSAPIRVREIIDYYKIDAEEAEKTGLPIFKDDCLPKVIILGGKNGTGKSEIARVIAQKTNRKLCFINCSLLGTKFQNSKGENFKNEIYPIFKLCEEKTPFVVVLDEADELTRQITNENKSTIESADAAVTQILDMGKNYNIMFICTTNFPQDLSSKLIDRAECEIIEVPAPDLKSRRGITECLMIDRAKKSKGIRRLNLQYESVDLDSIAKMTNGFSIRACRALINGAYLKAHKRAKKENLKDVVLTHQDILDRFKEIKESEKYLESLKAEKIAYGKSLNWETIRDKVIIPVVSDVASAAVKTVFLHPKILVGSADMVLQGGKISYYVAKTFWEIMRNNFKDIEKTKGAILDGIGNVSKSVREIGRDGEKILKEMKK